MHIFKRMCLQFKDKAFMLVLFGLDGNGRRALKNETNINIFRKSAQRLT